MRTNRLGGLLLDGGSWLGYNAMHTVREIVVDGVPRRLVTITQSGMLTIVGDVQADVWMCGAGGDGSDGMAGVKGGDGGGGGYVVQQQALALRSGPVTIATTSYGGTMMQGLTAVSGSAKNGGCGGGAGAMPGSAVNLGGTGDGLANKVPFGLADVFEAHCGGGGGGGFMGGGAGGAGGSQGGNGGAYVTGTTCGGGKGGAFGGGYGGTGFDGAKPGNGNGFSPLNLPFGAGGGGGGSGLNAAEVGSGAKGGQGVVYLLLKGE